MREHRFVADFVGSNLVVGQQEPDSVVVENSLVLEPFGFVVVSIVVVGGAVAENFAGLVFERTVAAVVVTLAGIEQHFVAQQSVGYQH